MIRVEHLYKNYGNSTKVFFDINLILEGGKTYVIIDNSGEGRSTFICCLSMLEIPTSGDIFYGEAEINDPGIDLAHVREKIGTVFQNFNLPGHMKAIDNVVYALRKVKKMSVEKARAEGSSLLEKIGLRHRADAYLHQLSSGGKQRCATARALTVEPDILLFGKPTSALDPEITGRILKVFQDLDHTGITVIVMTHEMNSAKKVADYVICMNKGNTKECNKTTEFLEESKTIRAREFLSKMIQKGRKRKQEMKKLLIGLIAVIMMTGLVDCDNKDDGAGKGSDTAKRELTVYANSDYKPHGVVDEKRNLYRFDIDVMDEAAKPVGYTVKWEDIDFDGIVPSVKQGEVNIGVADITYTGERAKQTDFSDVYYAGEDAQNYVSTMKSSDMKKTEDIKGEGTGIQMGTTQESILNSLQDEYKLKLSKKKAYSDMVLGMKKGVIDVMVVKKTVAEGLMVNNEGLSYCESEAGAELAGNVMISQKDNELEGEFSKAIKTIKENGKMDELVKKYFKQ